MQRARRWQIWSIEIGDTNAIENQDERRHGSKEAGSDCRICSPLANRRLLRWPSCNFIDTFELSKQTRTRTARRIIWPKSAYIS